MEWSGLALLAHEIRTLFFRLQAKQEEEQRKLAEEAKRKEELRLRREQEAAQRRWGREQAGCNAGALGLARLPSLLFAGKRGEHACPTWPR